LLGCQGREFKEEEKAKVEFLFVVMFQIIQSPPKL